MGHLRLSTLLVEICPIGLRGEPYRQASSPPTRQPYSIRPIALMGRRFFEPGEGKPPTASIASGNSLKGAIISILSSCLRTRTQPDRTHQELFEGEPFGQLASLQNSRRHRRDSSACADLADKRVAAPFPPPLLLLLPILWDNDPLTDLCGISFLHKHFVLGRPARTRIVQRGVYVASRHAL